MKIMHGILAITAAIFTSVLAVFFRIAPLRIIFLPFRSFVISNGCVPKVLLGSHLMHQLATDCYVMMLLWSLLLLGVLIVCMLILGWYKVIKRVFAS